MKFKKTIIGAITSVFLTSAALTASFAMPGMGKSAEQHDMAGMEMGSTATAIMLKGDEQEGVKAKAYLKDIKAAMAEYGSRQTHHFMVEFSADGGGKPMDTGIAAVKIIDPAGKESSPLKMMAMDGSFGVDVEINIKGTYHFEVGTKLKDGKKRLFRFQFDNSNV